MEFTLRPLNFFFVFVLKLNIKWVTEGGNGNCSVTFTTMFLEVFSLHILKKYFKSFHTNQKLEVLETSSYFIFFNCGFTNGFFPISASPLSLFYILFCQRNELKSHFSAQSSFSAQFQFAVKLTGFFHSHHVSGKIFE